MKIFDKLKETANTIKIKRDTAKFVEDYIKNQNNFATFTLHRLDENKSKITSLFDKKYDGLLCEDKILLDSDKIKYEDGLFLQDIKFSNKYYVKYINPISYTLKISKDEEVIEKKMTEITFSLEAPEKPAQPIINNITNNDYSTIIKGNKGNIGSENAKVENKTNVDISANLHKRG